MYVIRCVDAEEYARLKEYLNHEPKIKVTLFNSYHKGFIEVLNNHVCNMAVKIEYPRHMAVEVGWMVGRVKKGYLRNLTLELLTPKYNPTGVNEVLVIGEGYDE